MALTNEGLAIEIKNLSLQIADLKTLIAANALDYVKKDVFELRLKELENNQANTLVEIEKIRKEATKSNWKSHTLTAVFTAVLVLLVTYVLNSVLTK